MAVCFRNHPTGRMPHNCCHGKMIITCFKQSLAETMTNAVQSKLSADMLLESRESAGHRQRCPRLAILVGKDNSVGSHSTANQFFSPCGQENRPRTSLALG